jgi:L-ascorbate metabolism protein UlaG (beta-lactamase superfamily)
MLITELLPVFGATKIKNKTKFKNQVKITMGNKDESSFKGLLEFFILKKDKIPRKKIQNYKLDSTKIENPDNTKTQITWFGHSSVLIQSKKINILTDPVFSKRASPFQFIGPKSFKYQNKLKLNELPEIDYVLISHDHYDHLDYKTVKKLNEKVKNFLVPLGVKSHLIKWGIKAKKIKEFNWWDEKIIDDNTLFAYTPAQHFSGRKLTDRFKTLWGSWVIKINNKSIFFSGDSGYFKGFKEIGNKYGPFNLTMIENGAYSKHWPYVHMFPEETMQAHIDLKGEKIMPIHWGKFDLSYHPWREPVERLIETAKQTKQTIITPQLFETFNLETKTNFKKWWKTL